MSDTYSKEDYADLSLADLAQIMKAAREDHEEAKRKSAIAWNFLEFIVKTVIPEKMEDMGITSVNIRGVGRLGVTQDAYCRVESGKKHELLKWMDDNGFGDMIQDTINSSTLKSWAKEQIKAGAELPNDLINFEPYERATLTKITK